MTYDCIQSRVACALILYCCHLVLPGNHGSYKNQKTDDEERENEDDRDEEQESEEEKDNGVEED